MVALPTHHHLLLAALIVMAAWIVAAFAQIALWRRGWFPRRKTCRHCGACLLRTRCGR